MVEDSIGHGQPGFAGNLVLSDEEWEAIVYSIEKGTCVLLLGPGCAKNKRDECLYDMLCNHIARQIDDHSHNENDRLFTLYEEFKARKPRAYRPMTETILKEVYDHASPNSTYYKIAKIPFHLIISTSPDKMLPEIFDENKWEYQFKYYDRREKIIIKEKPSRNSPLILNLFGSYEERESLILTHDDIFDFLWSIIPDRSFPEIIRDEITGKETSFIFLGFDFESWYLKVILRLLLLHTKEKDAALAYPWQYSNLKNETKTFYSNKFNLKFIESNVDLFLDQLASRVSNPRTVADQQDLPLSIIAAKKAVYKVRACIRENELNEAVLCLTHYADEYDRSLRKYIDSSSGELSSLIHKQRKRLLTFEQEMVGSAKIRESLTGIISIIEETVITNGGKL